MSSGNRWHHVAPVTPSHAQSRLVAVRSHFGLRLDGRINPARASNRPGRRIIHFSAAACGTSNHLPGAPVRGTHKIRRAPISRAICSLISSGLACRTSSAQVSQGPNILSLLWFRVKPADRPSVAPDVPSVFTLMIRLLYHAIPFF